MFKPTSACGPFINLSRLHLVTEQVTEGLHKGCTTATRLGERTGNDVIHHSVDNLLLIKSHWNTYQEKKNPQQGSLTHT